MTDDAMNMKGPEQALDAALAQGNTPPTGIQSHTVEIPQGLIETPKAAPSKSRRTKKTVVEHWTTLVHHGPVFPDPYQAMPESIIFKYDGKKEKLSILAEETASLYAKVCSPTDTETFKNNFFADWKESMTSEDKQLITDFDKCDFRAMSSYFKNKKTMYNEELVKKHQYAVVNGIKVKTKNFKVEAPKLYIATDNNSARHGKVKKRLLPEDVTINCSSENDAPPPPDQWKKLVHDNSVKWLACWMDPIHKSQTKMLLCEESQQSQDNARAKFELARILNKFIDPIRKLYQADWIHISMDNREVSSIVYLIDELGIRIGGDETNNAIGACNLTCEHVSLNNEKNEVTLKFFGKAKVFDKKTFTVPVQVFKNFEEFMRTKNPADRLFGIDDTTVNNYLKTLITQIRLKASDEEDDELQILEHGLTAKVFRTKAASVQFEKALKDETNETDTKDEKLKTYRAARREVTSDILNHKNKNLNKSAIDAGSAEPDTPDSAYTNRVDLAFTYVDPRIAIQWCKTHGIQFKKVFPRNLQLERLKWAIDDVEKTPFLFSAVL